MPVLPHLTEKEREVILEQFSHGHDLRWEAVEENGYGGGYAAYAGKVCLFSAGAWDAFAKLYEEAHLLHAQEKEWTPKEIAIALLHVISDTPHGATYLCRKAQIGDSYQEAVDKILLVLAKAGKIKKVKVEGKRRWRLLRQS